MVKRESKKRVNCKVCFNGNILSSSRAIDNG